MVQGMDVKKSVLAFAGIAFLLLGVLFGMNIMAFIFGNLGNVNNFKDLTGTIDNETDAFLNSTFAAVYNLSVNADSNFAGGFIVTEAYSINISSGATLLLIPAANYTVEATLGTLTNATATAYPNVTFSGTYLFKGTPELISQGVNNYSLESIETYASSSNTQFTTLSVAITLVILLAVFAFFWFFFMGSQGGGRSKGNPRKGNFN